MGHTVLTRVQAGVTAHALGSQVAARVAQVQTALNSMRASGLLIYAQGETVPAGTVRYLTGLMPNGEAVCWIPAQGDLVVINNDRNAARAWAMVLAGQATVYKTTDLVATLREVFADVVPGPGPLLLLGFEEAPRARATELDEIVRSHDTVPDDGLVTRLRAVRTQHEADRQRAATGVADAMVQRCMEVAAIPGITGMDLMAEVELVGRRMGADKATCWLATGERPPETLMLGFELAPAIERTDRVQIGTTVMLDGYFSQVLRIGVFGEPSARMAEVSEQLIEMQDAALAAMVPGEPIVGIGDTLEAAIDAHCPYERAADPFRFQSCHAMGNSYTEPWSAPFLDPNRDRSRDAASPLVSVHQTYEIHPNFTLPDVGHVCAGDVALVGDRGAAWLSSTPRGLIRIA